MGGIGVNVEELYRGSVIRSRARRCNPTGSHFDPIDLS